MRKLIQIVVVIGLSLGLMGNSAWAAQAGHTGDVGFGAIFGSPTALSLKYWYSDMNAFDAAAGWHFGHDDQFQLHADHLWHFDIPSLKLQGGRLPLYAGLGARVLVGDDSEGGIRFPLGLSFLFDSAPIELFAEIVPVLEFAPDTDGSVEGGVGVRFYFK